jgi:hypothetical protein
MKTTSLEKLKNAIEGYGFSFLYSLCLLLKNTVIAYGYEVSRITVCTLHLVTGHRNNGDVNGEVCCFVRISRCFTRFIR